MCKKIIVILLMVSGFSPLIYAASFDCAKAGTTVEHLICNNNEVSRLDERLAERYIHAQEYVASKEIIKKEQRSWLKIRNTCVDVPCLIMSYEERIESLDKAIVKVETDKNSDDLVSKDAFVVGYGSNPYLQLCKDFKTYIERHADKPLYCELIPDEAFLNFRLPNWQPAPEGLALRIEIQERTVPKSQNNPYQFEDYQKLIKEAHDYVESGRYRVAKMDLNHDGEVERLLYRDNPSMCAQKKVGYHESQVYSDKFSIDSSFITSISGYLNQHGQIFFMKVGPIRSLAHTLAFKCLSRQGMGRKSLSLHTLSVISGVNLINAEVIQYFCTIR